MNIFRSYTFKWWQVSLLKLSLFSLGLFLGANASEVVAPWSVELLIVFGLTAAYLLYVTWIKR